MRLHQVAPEALADRAAGAVAAVLREAVHRRGRASVAFSGGATPAPALDALVGAQLPWDRVHVLQTDERVAPFEGSARNLRLLLDHLIAPAGIPPGNVHPIPVDDLDPETAASRYAQVLQEVCAGVLDLVHLGLGEDGHTASLVPGAPAADVVDRDVVATEPIGGWRRVTLTRPAIDRARRRLWLVAGGRKRAALDRLVAGDPDLPSGRIRRGGSDLFTDLDLSAAAPPAHRTRRTA